MSTTDPVEVVTDFIDRINSGDVPAIIRAMTPDHEFIDSAGSRLRGREAMLEAWRAYFRLFPDYRIHVERLISRPGEVVVLGRSSGTLSPEGAAELAGPDGAPPRDDELQGPAIWVGRVCDGLIASWQVFEDTPEARELLGISEDAETR
ncbi:MAG: nuclear transport factor 2 family protein [Coriobacteriia bacterium]